MKIGSCLAPNYLELKDKSPKKTTAKEIGTIRSSKKQFGKVCLVSPNLALLSSKSLQNKQLSQLWIEFSEGPNSSILQVVEIDEKLGYVVVLIDRLREDFLPLSIMPDTWMKEKQQRVAFLSENRCIEAAITLSKESVVVENEGEAIPRGAACVEKKDKKLIGIYLPSEEMKEESVLRISDIIEEKKDSILCRIKDKPTMVVEIPNSSDVYKTRKMHGTIFVVRPLSSELPGVIIEGYQKKHSPCWPGKWEGKEGSVLPLNCEEVVELVDVLIKEHADLFDTFHPKDASPKKIYWPIDQEALGNSLYNKLKGIKAIAMYTGFNKESRIWALHCFPKTH